MASGYDRLGMTRVLRVFEHRTMFPTLRYPGSGGFSLALAWASLTG
jgi:hypothetical protein